MTRRGECCRSPCVPGCAAHPCAVEQRDEYVPHQGGEQVFAPRYSWKGFRYVSVTGWPPSAGGGAASLQAYGQQDTASKQQGQRALHEASCGDDLEAGAEDPPAQPAPPVQLALGR